MSDFSQGPGWWQASDGKWYPPEAAPAAAAPAPTGPPAYAAPTGPPPGGPPAYGTPMGNPGYGAPTGAPGQLAEWPLRAASGAIDFVALFIVANLASRGSATLGFIIWLFALGFGIYNGYLNGSTGQSVGKKIVGTRVVSEATGQPIGGGAGVARFFAHIIDILICGIGYLFPLWDAKKQTIADKILKTVVITGAPKQSFGDAIKPS